MSRLVIFSNRLPVGPNPSGGLVVALHQTMQEKGGLWIGTAGSPEDSPQQELKRHDHIGFERLSVRLTPKEHRLYYNGYANSVLWPIFHGRPDLVDMNPDYFSGYCAVNRRLASLSAPHLRDDDIIWIHDYHLIPLAYELRRLGCRNRIGFFLHTPFPPAAHASILPHFDQIAEWLSNYDLVGLQAKRDVAAALDAFRALPNSQFLMNGRIKVSDRIFKLASFPISIDFDAFAETAKTADLPSAFRMNSDQPLIMGVDRLDYSKGLPQRLKGFQYFLTRQMDRPALKPTLLQIAPPTRESVDAYIDIRKELEGLSGEINGTFGGLDYLPVQYIHRSMDRSVLAGLFRKAAVGLVTPLMDGMNLVAKEYVAAQDPDNPGVLVLSKFAGAHEQLEGGAISVNPYDSVSIADGLETGLHMSRHERKKRYEIMAATLRAQDIHWWTKTFLNALDHEGAVEDIDFLDRAFA